MREQLDIKDMQIKILEKQKEEVLKFIEETCVYDKHLQGYCFGLKPGQVRTLVLKLGGRNESNI
jgi:hypothetical protein